MTYRKPRVARWLSVLLCLPLLACCAAGSSADYRDSLATPGTLTIGTSGNYAPYTMEIFRAGYQVMTNEEGVGVSDGLSGVLHILITPFTAAEEVDHDGLTAVVRAAYEAGAAGVVPLAIMGETHKLLDAERRAILDTVVAAADGRMKVIAGVTAESTYAAVARAREAEAAGADLAMLAPPRAAAVGPGLVAHYRAVAEASSLPVVVQDEPVTTLVKLPGSFFTEAAAIDGVVAAKVEEVPSPQKIAVIRSAAPGLACVGGLGGVSFFEELERGADGIMTGFGYPKILVDIFDAFVAGDREEARRIFYRYLPLIRFEAQLGVGGVGIRKHLFVERGLIGSPAVRGPAPQVDEGTVAQLRDLIRIMELGR